jgi:hypothetical protein
MALYHFNLILFIIEQIGVAPIICIKWQLIEHLPQQR